MPDQTRLNAPPAPRGKVRSFRRLASRLVAYAVIGLVLFYILFPLYWMLLSSFRSPNTVYIVGYWPTGLTPINYRFILLVAATLWALFESGPGIGL